MIAAMGWPVALFLTVLVVCLTLVALATLNNGRRP